MMSAVKISIGEKMPEDIKTVELKGNTFAASLASALTILMLMCFLWIPLAVALVKWAMFLLSFAGIA